MNIILLIIGIVATIEGLHRLSGSRYPRAVAIVWLVAGIVLLLLSFALIRL